MIATTYCQACGSTVSASGSRDGLCRRCWPRRASALLGRLFATGDTELLGTLEIESIVRLRRLRRLVKAGHRFD